MMKVIIEAEKLSKTYEYFRKPPGLMGSFRSFFRREKLFTQAVRDVSFTITEGELVGFLGPNGAGKTTTLKMLSGIVHPTAGIAHVLGYTPWERNMKFQKQFSIIMGQKSQLWWDLPAEDSFLMNKEIYEIPETHYRETLKELCEMLDVQNLLDVQIRKLSLGERMKMELIGALLHKPKVLFLDEPTIGLDIVSQHKLREFILHYNRIRCTTILLTSHYMKDVERLCNRIIIINHGILVYDGKLHDLLVRYGNNKKLTVTFDIPVRREEMERYGMIKEFTPQRAILEVSSDSIKQAAQEILTSYEVDEILIGEVELEEVVKKVFNG